MAAPSHAKDNGKIQKMGLLDDAGGIFVVFPIVCVLSVGRTDNVPCLRAQVREFWVVPQALHQLQIKSNQGDGDDGVEER